MTATEQVILVDKNDRPIGTAEKLAAHQQGLCHRAFSIFIIRQLDDIEILLQQRAKGKYHSANLWTNTCCSHPRMGESVIEAGQRRLNEEMGLSAELTHLGHFHYIAHFDNGLIENEIDHVLIGGIGNRVIELNPEEAQAYRWITLHDLKNEIAAEPEKFTPWLAAALAIVEEHLNFSKI
jgi:isopentenyl-diphosphate delta-isomerase